MLKICMFSIQKNSEYLRKLMTKITMKDVLSKVQVREQVILQPTRHMRYDLTLHLLPHRCYDSITHITPKMVMRFIRHEFTENLKKMFLKNLSTSFSGELISEQAKRAFKLNREQNENIDENELIVSLKQGRIQGGINRGNPFPPFHKINLI